MSSVERPGSSSSDTEDEHPTQTKPGKRLPNSRNPSFLKQVKRSKSVKQGAAPPKAHARRVMLAKTSPKIEPLGVVKPTPVCKITLLEFTPAYKTNLQEQIYCKSEAYNPFDVSDETAHERSRHSYHNLEKYSVVTEMCRSKAGNFCKKVSGGESINSKLTNSYTNKKYFTDFLIIGLEDTDFAGSETVAHPKVLYQYRNHHGQVFERIETCKDFCFPEGIKLTQITADSSEIENVLYGKLPFRESSFNFTLNDTAKEEAEDYINFICLTYDSLVVNRKDKKIYKSK